MNGTGAMFDRIAARYDLLNRLNSLGMDRAWRRKAVASLALPASGALLDVATGTGDLLTEVSRIHPGVRLYGLDASENMLALAKRKVPAELIHGDALALPFSDCEMDGVSCCFGVRNISDRRGALGEMHRVLRSNRRVAILELTEPESTLFSVFARAHVRTVVPALGALFSDAEAYRYLEQSISAFPTVSEFSRLMLEVGFVDVCNRRFALGACSLFVGRKP